MQPPEPGLLGCFLLLRLDGFEFDLVDLQHPALLVRGEQLQQVRKGNLLDGAAQAFSTRLPEVSVGGSLQSVVDQLPSGACRLALDNYEASDPLSRAEVSLPVALAAGPERGWSVEEREALRGSGFTLVHLGERVLRVETACVAAVAITKARLDLL